MNYDLSILIPARNEEWLARTVQDLLEHKRGNTEILIGLDGEWSNPGIEQHHDVTIVYYPESIGQRAMTNQLCRLSKAKYVMKVDAHCAFEKGFDVKLMADMQDDWTVVPIMRNLHVFDWVCEQGHRRYQGPSGPCTECGNPTQKDVVWNPKRSPQSTSYLFDPTLHFQYFGSYKKRQTGDLVETMSLQGSCFMMTREKYWSLNICDEGHGSWGQQGTEVACKTWLSGGRCVVNKKTWYAHLFRTQGGDFGFPYPNPGVEKARKYSKDIWFNNKYEHQIYPLSWLVEKFWPVEKWTEEDLAKIKAAPFNKPLTKGIIYYTDNQLNLKIAKTVQKQLRNIGLPIVSASLKPMDNMGTNIVIHEPRGYSAYFKQIIAALEASTADIVFFCEHDVLYHPSHFEFTPKEKDKFYYNQNVWRWKYPSDHFVTWDANQVAELCCYREHALGWYKEKFKQIESGKFDRSFEPGGRDETQYEIWRSEHPNIDIRHGANLTKSKWSINDFRDKTTAINFRAGTIPDWAKGIL